MEINMLKLLLQFLWELLSSRTAIGLYALIVLGLIIGLVIAVLRSDAARVQVIAPSKEKGHGTGTKQTSSPGTPERAEGESRFFMLSRTDRYMKKYAAPAYNKEVTLASFCESFQAYAAGNLGLYYDISDIRRFISNLGVSHILVMQGMSGTGKTSLAYAFGEFIGNPSVIVPIQPMWKERTDMIGYYNEFTGKFNETLLLQKMYEANYSKDMYITVLDEMNIARVEYYFAEFLSLLELPDPEKRYIDVVSDVQKGDPALLKGGRLKLPPNMWFVGTANTGATSSRLRRYVRLLRYKSGQSHGADGYIPVQGYQVHPRAGTHHTAIYPAQE